MKEGTPPSGLFAPPFSYLSNGAHHRSTVSKVLSNKDQFLRRNTTGQENDPASSSKRFIKGKADFERTLSNYITKQVKNNQAVSDAEILERGTQFARASGVKEPLSQSWLAKFKQKYSFGNQGHGSNRLLRRASETNIPDSVKMNKTALPKLKKKSSSGIVSPASPTGQMSPLSEGKSDEDAGRPVEGLGLDFTYQQPRHSQSTTSLNDAANSSFSGGVVSPTGTYTFSPDPNSGGFGMDQQLRGAGPETQHREKRSNTFPSLGIDANPLAVHNESRHSATQPLESPSAAAPFILDSAANLAPNNTMSSPPPLRRSSSNSSITARGQNETSPASPSAEDARRAANTLITFMQNGVPGGTFDQGEYMMVLQMAKKLQVSTGAQPMQQQQQQQQQDFTPGGLQRIPEGDAESHLGLGDIKMST